MVIQLFEKLLVAKPERQQALPAVLNEPCEWDRRDSRDRGRGEPQASRRLKQRKSFSGATMRRP
jgi:hypothetical protein